VTGVFPLAFGLDTIGPLARSVEDIAILLGERLGKPALEGLRFARLENAQRVHIEPECEAAFEAALASLVANGIGVQTELHLASSWHRRDGQGLLSQKQMPP
jgi:aspartyl-tRNA(Asn)/glutamyl-tRNA(Gln) amidotransferase subunit A